MDETLARLAADYWALQMERSPITGMLIGDFSHTGEIDDLSRAAEDDAIDRAASLAATAEAIDPGNLTGDERVTRAVLVEDAHTLASELSTRPAEIAVDHTMGLHVVLLQLAGHVVAPTPEAADSVVGTWSRMGTMFRQAVERLRQGVAKGRTPPRLAVERTIAQIHEYLASEVADDPFARPAAPASFDGVAEANWRDNLNRQVVDVIRPAYAAYRDALRDEVLAHGRPEERSGLCWLEDGEQAYAAAIRRHTTMDPTPLAVHHIGLEEIAGLEDEYRRLGAGPLETGDVAEMYRRLRDDPGLRFSTREEVLEAARVAMGRAREALPGWFGRLPRTGCEMAEIAGAGASDSTLAFYLEPAIDGSRPGTYFVNTGRPSIHTRYEAEALAFHESIPGHHLQIAIGQEVDGLPDFRRHAAMTVFVEGWGLYAERLADEMGLYTSDLSRLGMLSFDSWRAGRLVVDTGIHALGWSRRQAIDFLTDNSPQVDANVANEIDRYIGWPGQALAYKLGQREIHRIRAAAELQLGTGFDVRAFHDVVLGSGPVPVAVLDEMVTQWATR
jgi:uncharacterized protein (DUF885 family)